jgi:hypothetical protein
MYKSNGLALVVQLMHHAHTLTKLYEMPETGKFFYAEDSASTSSMSKEAATGNLAFRLNLANSVSNGRLSPRFPLIFGLPEVFYMLSYVFQKHNTLLGAILIKNKVYAESLDQHHGAFLPDFNFNPLVQKNIINYGVLKKETINMVE